MEGDIQRADGSIVMLDENKAEVRYFTRGWPKIYRPSFNALRPKSHETLEIAHEGW